MGQGWAKRLRDDGVSGMSGEASVKCLHTHYAHWLARGEESVIGGWVDDVFNGRLQRGR